MVGKYAVSKVALYVRPRFNIGDLTTSYSVVLAMVGTECSGGHYDRDFNDVAGTVTPHYFSCSSD